MNAMSNSGLHTNDVRIGVHAKFNADVPNENRFKLLENGEQYFPAVFEALEAARETVLIETFILFEDRVGNPLREVLIKIARRGVSVDLTVDGYGSPDLSPEYLSGLTEAGVRIHFFDPRPRLLGFRTNIFRRMHRKIVAIDGKVAFIGGINFGADQLIAQGPKAKQDYAVRIDGPLAMDIFAFAQRQVAVFYKNKHRWWRQFRPWLRRPEPNGHSARLIYRDNDEHRDDIERHYRYAIQAAKREVVIACAYFFPGYRLLKSLCDAARRGVDVRLILQGEPDMPQAMTWAEMLYPMLLDAGVVIYEYCRRPMHAKVAAIDDNWSTVGSSNLDPLSLALNLEANVIIRDPQFVAELRANLQSLMQEHCKPVERERIRRGTLWRRFSSFISYHGTRHFPKWAGWLPAHLPTLHSLEPGPFESISLGSAAPPMPPKLSDIGSNRAV